MRRECRERFPRHWLQRTPLINDPGMHHGTCVTHVPWCMSGSLTSCGGEHVPGIPGACATHNFTYLARSPLRRLWQDHFISARVLTAWINNRLLSRSNSAYRLTRKPLLTANHHRLCLEWAQSGQKLTMAHWKHVIFGDGSRFQLYLGDGRLSVRHLPGERFQQRCQAYRVHAHGGSVHVWGAFHSVARSRLVLSERHITGEHAGAFCENLSAICQAAFR